MMDDRITIPSHQNFCLLFSSQKNMIYQRIKHSHL